MGKEGRQLLVYHLYKHETKEWEKIITNNGLYNLFQAFSMICMRIT